MYSRAVEVIDTFSHLASCSLSHIWKPNFFGWEYGFLSLWCWQDEMETKPQLARNDPREIQKFYQWYYENYVKEGPIERKP